jgi:hypothetical protein
MVIKNPTPEQVVKALLAGNKEFFLLDELIATGEAIFNLIRLADADSDLKYTAFQLEKRFTFYASLIQENS